jgi:hypothetical protein
MKSIHCFHLGRRNFVALAALLLFCALAAPSQAQSNPPTVKRRIGIYDSRAVAVAFAGSAAQEKEMKELREAHQKAKAAGDSKTVARLEAEGKARQAKAHQQAFSTAPVADLLAHITNALPDIQKAAGVTALISKWDEAELKKHAGAETVDVTMPLVDAFHPTERQRKSALEIQKHKPVSLKQAGRIKD